MFKIMVLREKNNVFKKIVLFWFYIFISVSVYASAPTLNIIATAFSPFVIEQGENIEGFSIDLLQRISEISDFKYTVKIEKSIPNMYETMGENKADLAVGGFPLTHKYEHLIDYTYPIFKSGSVILSLKKKKTHYFGGYVGDFLGALFSEDVVKGVFILLFLLFLSANIVWFAERKNNPKMFPKNYLEGIWESFWWSSVTITTVGYGDKTPRSLIGRLCALVWMFAGIFVISYFTATISSSQTVDKLTNKFNTPQDIIGKQVGTVKGNTVTGYLKSIGVRVFEFNTIDKCYIALKKQLVTAVVFDAPVLKYYVKRDSKDQFALGNAIFKDRYYGFVVPEDSPYKDQINYAIIKLQESGEYELIYEKWFGFQ